MALAARVRVALLAVGAGVLALLVWQAGPREVVERLAAIGPRWPLVLLPSVLVMVTDTVAWGFAFAPGVSVSFPTLLKVRIAGEAVNLLTPAAYLGGEPVKAYLLAPAVPLAEGLSAAIVSRTLMTLAHVLFVILGIAAALGRFQGHPSVLAASMGLMALATAALLWLVLRQQRGLVGGLVRGLARLGVRPRWLAARAGTIAELDACVARLYREGRGRLYLSLVLFFAGWAVGIGETYLALVLMGLPADLPTAFALEALAGMAKGLLFVIPGSVGGQEGAHALLFAGFGYPLAAAIGYSVIRRVRELLWAALGLAILAREGRVCRPDLA
ncbi:MAG TPA: lysylphosphatidylglycerol synthase domain-containing protein [Thermodesulfobacteriota bacterium]|nr:lysylphosphatidylglycerol synthase domain-containing protein [Thermodesulfobacteriota bacterium]